MAAVLLRSAELFTALPGNTPVAFDPEGKVGGDGSVPSLSRKRHIMYRDATTLDQFYRMHPASARGDKRNDLFNDVRKGLASSPGMEFPVVHLAQLRVPGQRERGRRPRVQHLDWRTVPDPSGDEWVRGFESRMAVHRVHMATDSVN